MNSKIKLVKHKIIIIFSMIIGFICVASFVTVLAFKITKPHADVTVFLHIFLMSFSYLAGILTGLLGLSNKP